MGILGENAGNRLTISIVKPKSDQEEIIQALEAIVELLKKNRNKNKYSLKVSLEELLHK